MSVVESHELGPRVSAWFTSRASGNLAHRRPHEPRRLGADRAAAFASMRTSTGGVTLDDAVWMHQVHGNAVGVVDADTVPGAEVRGVDALVTDVPGRALVVQVADCVPVLLAHGDGTVVGAAHAGRNGVLLGVIDRTVAAMRQLGADPEGMRAVVGPAIRGCCYEVPAPMRDEVAAVAPAASATTSWGTPSLDLPAAVLAQLEDHGIVATADAPCVRCDPEERWFSHRRDPASGRQVGVVVGSAA